MRHYIIGIDLGGTSCKFGLFGLAGVLINRWSIYTNKKDNGQFILKDIANSIQNKLKEMSISLEEIDGIGLGVPGPVTESSKVAICANLGWRNKEAGVELEALLHRPVEVGNDANLAALGEMWQGSAKGYQNLVLITLGTGVGGGVVVNGQMVPGCFGAAGEIGHMPIVFDETEPCGCGKMGCLEQAASATGMINAVHRLLEKYEISSPLRNQEKLTARSIFEAARTGDWIANQAIERAGHYLGIAMACIAAVTDPQIFLLGGGVASAGQLLIDVVNKHYREQVLYISKDTKVKLASLGNDAGIYGAAYLIATDK